MNIVMQDGTVSASELYKIAEDGVQVINGTHAVRLPLSKMPNAPVRQYFDGTPLNQIILTGVSRGQSSAEIASSLGKSESHISKLRSNLHRIFQSRGTANLTLLGFVHGYLDVDPQLDPELSLSRHEAIILGSIALGLTNDEVATESKESFNNVITSIRKIGRTLGYVTTREMIVRRGVENDLL